MKPQKFKRAGEVINRTSVYVSLLTILTLVYDLGVNRSESIHSYLYIIYLVGIGIGFLSLGFRYGSGRFPRAWARIFDIIYSIFLLGILTHHLEATYVEVISHPNWVYLAVFLVFIREFSTLDLDIYHRYLNPGQLFIVSFMIIIIIGTFLLLLPRATFEGITFTDAFFTSTSAVCVTGLVVVDTGSYFTTFGQSIILILIQIGGIGIMTFTSYFSYYFHGNTSYENQLLLKDLTNSERLGDVFDTLKKIILLTILIEIIGAGIIYLTVDHSTSEFGTEGVFFAIFHAISAFCNAGFSTLTNSLYEADFRFNYALHAIIALLFIIGGIGFPIVFNSFKYVKYVVVHRILRREWYYKPWIMNLNSRLVLITTTSLLIVGTMLFYLFEYHNTLAEHRGAGKFMVAFFGAATPRTAGFNSIDTAALNLPTLMIIFLLMWIGASPGSTGGGIKTTAFAIGTLNFFSTARGKDRLEVFQREVSHISVRRAFSVISLSLIVIGLSVFIITIFDPEKELLAIAFESFSAYSTVGLSLGITSSLSTASKWTIIITMFIGRVSMLTILAAILRNMKYLKYRYPTENILIN